MEVKIQTIHRSSRRPTRRHYNTKLHRLRRQCKKWKQTQEGEESPIEVKTPDEVDEKWHRAEENSSAERKVAQKDQTATKT
jgi:hypothetical protein